MKKYLAIIATALLVVDTIRIAQNLTMRIMINEQLKKLQEQYQELGKQYEELKEQYDTMKKDKIRQFIFECGGNKQ